MGNDGRTWQANKEHTQSTELWKPSKAEGTDLINLLNKALIITVDVGEWERAQMIIIQVKMLEKQ
jgi:hypothetical protein